MFTEPEENNYCFSIIIIIAQVRDYQSNCIFFYFIHFFFKNIKKLHGGYFEN